jgi:hypothetical protein
MEKYISLNILESGHKLLKENTVKEIDAILKKIKNDSRKP